MAAHPFLEDLLPQADQLLLANCPCRLSCGVWPNPVPSGKGSGSPHLRWDSAETWSTHLTH